MNVMSLVKVGIVVSLSLVVSSIHAVPMPKVPTEPIYFEPPVETATEEIHQQSCVQLDNAIRYLHPYQYSYKPAMYDDSFNAIATTLSLLDIVPMVGFAYMGYSSLVEEKEQRRILQVGQKIAMLQQVKAEKHCFE